MSTPPDLVSVVIRIKDQSARQAAQDIMLQAVARTLKGLLSLHLARYHLETGPKSSALSF